MKKCPFTHGLLLMLSSTQQKYLPAFQKSQERQAFPVESAIATIALFNPSWLTLVLFISIIPTLPRSLERV